MSYYIGTTDAALVSEISYFGDSIDPLSTTILAGSQGFHQVPHGSSLRHIVCPEFSAAIDTAQGNPMAAGTHLGSDGSGGTPPIHIDTLPGWPSLWHAQHFTLSGYGHLMTPWVLPHREQEGQILSGCVLHRG